MVTVTGIPGAGGGGGATGGSVLPATQGAGARDAALHHPVRGGAPPPVLRHNSHQRTPIYRYLLNSEKCPFLTFFNKKFQLPFICVNFFPCTVPNAALRLPVRPDGWSPMAGTGRQRAMQRLLYCKIAKLQNCNITFPFSPVAIRGTYKGYIYYINTK